MADYGAAIGATVLPTFAVLDQDMVIREIWTGEPTCAELGSLYGGTFNNDPLLNITTGTISEDEAEDRREV